MNSNSLVIQAIATMATLSSIFALSSPVHALSVVNNLTGVIEQTTGVSIAPASEPGPVIGVNSQTAAQVLNQTGAALGLPDDIQAVVSDVTSNELSVGLVDDDTLINVNENLLSATEILAPIVPAEIQALVDLGVTVDAGAIAQVNANACVGAGVNASAPGCQSKAIPTPALLPGILGLGLGLLRQRQSRQTERVKA